MLPSYCAATRDTRWFSPAPIVRFDTRGWPSSFFQACVKQVFRSADAILWPREQGLLARAAFLRQGHSPMG